MSGPLIQVWPNQSTVIQLPPALELTAGGEMVSQETIMISGKMVQDVIGYRKTYTAKWDYYPQSELAKLLKLIRTGAYYECMFPDVEGISGGLAYYKIEQSGDMSFFKYANGQSGTPIWYGITLKFTAQEVVSND